ncbi:MAG: Ca2+-dependent phosphoinositide-specific phospholipase C, partial [Bacteroidota bacterium]
MSFIKFMLLFSLLVVGLSYPIDKELRMNQVQVIGSHNSYKQSIEPDLMEMMVAFNPKAKELEYGHLPLSKQLDLGLRGLEIDVLYDPEGGRYTRPKGLAMLEGQGKLAQTYDTSELVNPGFKVLHIPDIDFRTHCTTFKGCLSTIKQWSEQHSNHLPIFITLNPKTSG